MKFDKALEIILCQSILQAVMVRLILILTPASCMLCAIAFSSLMTTFIKNLDHFKESYRRKNRATEENYSCRNTASSFSLYLVNNRWQLIEVNVLKEGREK